MLLNIFKVIVSNITLDSYTKKTSQKHSNNNNNNNELHTMSPSYSSLPTQHTFNHAEDNFLHKVIY